MDILEEIRKKKFLRKHPDRCGNCHEKMRPDDKYCSICGTQRGQGSFHPYVNQNLYAYGPPVKRKYKCEKCGYLWIDQRRGAEDAGYCPQCGEPSVRKQVDRALWEFAPFYRIATDKPYDESDRPQLFTEEEIKRLLFQRKQKKDAFSNEFEVFEAMKKAGFTLPEKMVDKQQRKQVYPRTEKEEAQLLLANGILHTTGTVLRGYQGIRCPHCKNEIVAAIKYTILGDHYVEIKKDFHAPGMPGALICDLDQNWILNRDDQNDGMKHYAYLCLCCGDRFGEFSKESIDELKETANKLENKK